MESERGEVVARVSARARELEKRERQREATEKRRERARGERNYVAFWLSLNFRTLRRLFSKNRRNSQFNVGY